MAGSASLSEPGGPGGALPRALRHTMQQARGINNLPACKPVQSPSLPGPDHPDRRPGGLRCCAASSAKPYFVGVPLQRRSARRWSERGGAGPVRTRAWVSWASAWASPAPARGPRYGRRAQSSLTSDSLRDASRPPERPCLPPLGFWSGMQRLPRRPCLTLLSAAQQGPRRSRLDRRPLRTTFYFAPRQEGWGYISLALPARDRGTQ